MAFVGENPSILGQKLHPVPPRYEHDLSSQAGDADPGPGVSTMKGFAGFPAVPAIGSFKLEGFFVGLRFEIREKFGRIRVITCENMIGFYGYSDMTVCCKVFG